MIQRVIPDNPEKNTCPENCAASGATVGPANAPTDPDLQVIIETWADLSKDTKAAIMEQAVRPSHPTITPRPLEATPSDALSPWPKSSPRIPGRAQNARRPLRRSE